MGEERCSHDRPRAHCLDGVLKKSVRGKAVDWKAKQWPLVYVVSWPNGKRASNGTTYGARTMFVNLKW
jgi:hypothetical protein